MIPTRTKLSRALHKLSESQMRDALNELQDGSPFAWSKSENRDAIMKVFQFRDFSEAWSFLTRSALLAEKMDHHPEIFNIYGTVEVTLTTHDCDGVSEKVRAMYEHFLYFTQSRRKV